MIPEDHGNGEKLAFRDWKSFKSGVKWQSGLSPELCHNLIVQSIICEVGGNPPGPYFRGLQPESLKKTGSNQSFSFIFTHYFIYLIYWKKYSLFFKELAGNSCSKFYWHWLEGQWSASNEVLNTALFNEFNDNSIRWQIYNGIYTKVRSSPAHTDHTIVTRLLIHPQGGTDSDVVFNILRWVHTFTATHVADLWQGGPKVWASLLATA